MNWQKTVTVQNLSKNEIYVHILNFKIQHVSEKSAFVFFGFDLKCLVFLTLRCGHGSFTEHMFVRDIKFHQLDHTKT